MNQTLKNAVRLTVPGPVRRLLKRSLNYAEAFFKGYARRCPLCRYHLRDFTPLLEANHILKSELETNGFDLDLLRHFETLNVDHYSCPNCGSSDRERLYFLFLQRELQHLNGTRVSIVDFAPTQPLRQWLACQQNVTYRSADLFMRDVDDKVDIQQLTIYNDRNFDGFICSHVLEHVPDDGKAMRELYRILRPGGWGILMAPILLTLRETREDPNCEDPAERIRSFAQSDHVRLYAKNDFLKRLQSAGFVVSEFKPAQFGQKVCDVFGITDQSVLYVGRRPS